MGKEKMKVKELWTIRKYRSHEDYLNDKPFDVAVVEGNLALNSGIDEMWKLITGDTTATNYGNANAQLGVGDNAAPVWAASTAYNVGDRVEPTTANGFVYECTTAGTSDATEPAWPTTEGATVTDGTVVWTAHSKAENAAQTGLVGANRTYVAVDTGYPVIATPKCTWQATFDGTTANHPWQEFAISNGTVNLNRKVSDQGTKISGQVWTLTLEITMQ